MELSQGSLSVDPSKVEADDFDVSEVALEVRDGDARLILESKSELNQSSRKSAS